MSLIGPRCSSVQSSFCPRYASGLKRGAQACLAGGLLLAAAAVATPRPPAAAAPQARDGQGTRQDDRQDKKSESSTTLKGVTVSATALPSGTTEGTHSYTTGAAGTATPLEMSLRETPQSVSVVTQQRIQDQDLDTVLDVVRHGIGLSARRVETNRATFSSRGFYIRRLMIDGVPSNWGQGSGWNSQAVIGGSLAFYDRVEIVRGANGLMTGAGSPSASINLVHKRATSPVFTGWAKVDAGSWNHLGAQLDLSTPLNGSGSVRGRVVAGFNKGDSWIDRYSNQRRYLYGTVDVDLGADTTLWLGASYQHNDSDAPMWGGLPIWHSDGRRTHYDRSTSTAPDWNRWDSGNRNYFAHLEHRFAGGWKLRASYSHGQRQYQSYLLFASGSPDPLDVFLGGYDMDRNFDSFSLAASGSFDVFGRPMQTAFGYVHNRQTLDADQHTPRDSQYPDIPDFSAYRGDYPEPVWDEHHYVGKETTQQAVYGVARYAVAEPLHVIVGVRLNRYERSGEGQYVPRFRMKHSVVTPYAGLVYDINRHLSAYASYTDIFQPQNNRDIHNRILDPIVGKSTEVGLKGAFMAGRLNASLALFRIKQDNLAQTTGEFIDGDPNRPAYRAADGATSRGFEAQLSGRLAEGWQASLGYTRFQLEDASGKAVNTLFPIRLFKLFTSYRFPGAWSALTVGGGVAWQDDSYTLLTGPLGNQQRVSQDAYALVSLMARYAVNTHLDVQLNVGNALDKTYYNIYGVFGDLTWGAPRNVRVSVKYRF